MVKWLLVRRCFGFSAAGPPPMGHRAALAALHIYKARVPPSSALPALSASHSFCHPLSLGVPFPPNGPALTACCGARARCANHFFSDTLVTTWVRPGYYLDPDPFSGPLLLIRPPLDPTFLASGLAFTVMSMACLVFPIAGCPLAR